MLSFLLCFHRLRELHLSFNEYTSIELPADQTFPSVTHFFFNSNAITCWSDVRRLGQAFPRLEHLVMTSNPLSEFGGQPATADGAAGGLVDSPGVEFPHLKSLNIGMTPIKSWEELDELRKFPHLVDIRLHGIECTEVCKDYLVLSHFRLFFSARCNIYISCLCYDVSVRLSVLLSVMFVHCGHRVQWIPDTFACLDRWMSLLLTDNVSPGSSDGMMPGFLVEEGRGHLVLC